MLSKADKAEQISLISSHFEKSNGNFVVQFQGLNVEKVTELRSKLRNKQAQMKIMRNTLMARALEKYPHLKEAFSDSLSGANAFIFSFGDASETAKILADFSEENEVLKLKKGVIGQDVLLEKEIYHLASLPSLNELRVQFISLCSSPASSLLRVMGGVSSSFVCLLNACCSSEEGKK